MELFHKVRLANSMGGIVGGGDGRDADKLRHAGVALAGEGAATDRGRVRRVQREE